MKKKGQSISINTIIIAAIALAVLIVLFAIFTGRLGIFSKGVQDTDTCTQKCTSLNLKKTTSDVTAAGCSTTSGGQQIAGKYSDVTGENNVCCCTP